MALFHLFLLSVIVVATNSQNVSTASNGSYDYRGHRLPNIFSPSLYDIKLEVPESVFNGTSANFIGTVSIGFQVTAATDNIQIHSDVNISTIILYSGNQTTVHILNSTYNATTSILVVNLNSSLSRGIDYSLIIDYIGYLSSTSMQGFYLSKYENENGTTEYLVTTQFESTYARKAFPCFDEPHFKAQYDISITYPTGFNALANTPQVGVESLVNTSYEIATFARTPIMSTYLVAFVISKFTCTAGANLTSNVPHQVCSRNETAVDRVLANVNGPWLMQILENITNITYSELNIGKMDQVAIPDFEAGAMENWGLVTYREVGLLWNTDESTNLNQQRVICVIAHEFAHMWFGNLVTMDWWNNIFLNEGFARYFQYFATSQLFDTWEMDKQFIIEQLHTAFVVDGSNTSKALTANVATPREISSKFDSLSYNKGACIFRMVENMIGNSNFLNALRQYLKAHANSTVNSSNIIDAFQSNTPAEVLPVNITLATVLHNWLNEPGYPVIKATLVGNDVVLMQSRFLYNGSNPTQWYVPISFTVSTNVGMFSNVSVSNWLLPQSNLTLTNVTSNGSWIIINNRQSSYYRVNYDSTLWSRLKQVLYDNHTLVDVLNRAQIVDDLCNLALAAQITYSDALDILEYLKNETEYYPWYTANTCFSKLLTKFGETSEVGSRINSLHLNLIQNAYLSVTFTNLYVNDSDQMHTLKVSEIVQMACKLGEQPCIDSAKNLFESSKNGTRIGKNLKSLVYCTALRHSKNIQEDWSYLWGVFRNTSISTVKVSILAILGCTRNSTYLNDALEQSLNSSSGVRVQDLSTLWSSVYSSNSEGVDVALEFYSNNHERISKYVSSAGSLLVAISSRITTNSQLQKLDQLRISGNLSATLQETANGAAEIARSNIGWSNNRRPEFESYFNISSTNNTTAASTGATTPVTSPPTSPIVPATTDGGVDIISKMSFVTILCILICQVVLR